MRVKQDCGKDLGFVFCYHVPVATRMYAKQTNQPYSGCRKSEAKRPWALGLGPGAPKESKYTHILWVLLSQQDDQNTLGQFCGELTDVEHLKMNLRHDSIGNNGTSKKRLAKENLLDSGCTCLRNSGSFAGSPP